MSTRLRNRRAIEEKLGAFIEAVAVPEDLAAGIMDAEVRRAGLGGACLPAGRACARGRGLPRRCVDRSASTALHAQPCGPRRRLCTRPRALRAHATHPLHPPWLPQVNEEYLEHLLALDRKIKFLAADDTARGSQARRDAEVVLDKLRIKAVTKVQGAPPALARCRSGFGLHAPHPSQALPSHRPRAPPSPTQLREFLLSKLYQLRKPKTNISIIQQNVLLKHKYFVRFMREHAPDLYQEVRPRPGAPRTCRRRAHMHSWLARTRCRVAGVPYGDAAP